MKRILRTFVLPAAAASALALSACGSSTASTAGASSSSHDMSGMSGMSSSTSSAPASPATAAGQHNTADVAFATGMIPHHAQAVQMADMALKAARSAKVKTLAAQVKAAQDPEIKTMSGWLTSWGKPIPKAMTGHDMSAMGGMVGMMSSTDMASLGKAKGAAFDRMWLAMMTKHHQGAVTMAKTELTQGRYPSAKTLARSIITSQTKQIAYMKTLLGSSSGMNGMSGM